MRSLCFRSLLSLLPPLRGFFQQAEVKAVRAGALAFLTIAAMLVAGQQGSAIVTFYPPIGCNGAMFSICLSGQETADLLSVFLRQNRAGGVEQDAARGEAGPEGIQQPLLDASLTGDGGLFKQQFDVWMAADDASGGARGIQQNPLERIAIPPLAGAGCIGVADSYL